MPQRIQRRRVKGWRMPGGAVYVGQPSYFGNPFIVGQTTPADWHTPFADVGVGDRAHAVELLSAYLDWRRRKPAGWCSPTGPNFPWESQIKSLLRGRDLLCWCPADQPCHADLLLHIANETASP